MSYSPYPVLLAWSRKECDLSFLASHRETRGRMSSLRTFGGLCNVRSDGLVSSRFERRIPQASKCVDRILV